MRWIILALGLVAAPAAAADQFDLACTAGKESMRYRIDLAAGEYCFGKCETVMKVQEVTAGMITLYSVEPVPPDRSRRYSRINRQTGAWEWYDYSPRISSSTMDIKGTCQPEPFSGFPSSKF